MKEEIRKWNKKKCLMCEKYQEKRCILNHDMSLERHCIDFTTTIDLCTKDFYIGLERESEFVSNIDLSNLSKEKIIEMWKNTQRKIKDALESKKHLEILLERKEINEDDFLLSKSKEEIIQRWKDTENEFIRARKENIRLQILLSEMNHLFFKDFDDKKKKKKNIKYFSRKFKKI